MCCFGPNPDGLLSLGLSQLAGFLKKIQTGWPFLSHSPHLHHFAQAVWDRGTWKYVLFGLWLLHVNTGATALALEVV